MRKRRFRDRPSVEDETAERETTLGMLMRSVEACSLVEMA